MDFEAGPDDHHKNRSSNRLILSRAYKKQRMTSVVATLLLLSFFVNENGGEGTDFVVWKMEREERSHTAKSNKNGIIMAMTYHGRSRHSKEEEKKKSFVGEVC